MHPALVLKLKKGVLHTDHQATLALDINGLSTFTTTHLLSWNADLLDHVVQAGLRTPRVLDAVKALNCLTWRVHAELLSGTAGLTTPRTVIIVSAVAGRAVLSAGLAELPLPPSHLVRNCFSEKILCAVRVLAIVTAAASAFEKCKARTRAEQVWARLQVTLTMSEGAGLSERAAPLEEELAHVNLQEGGLGQLRPLLAHGILGSSRHLVRRPPSVGQWLLGPELVPAVRVHAGVAALAGACLQQSFANPGAA